MTHKRSASQPEEVVLDGQAGELQSGLGLGGCAETGNLIRVTQRQAVSRTWRPWIAGIRQAGDLVL